MKHKKILLISACLLAASLGMTGAFAYYAAQTKTVENTFNIVAGGAQGGEEAGSVEEVFDPLSAKDLEPRSSFAKAARIKSNAEYSAYVYMFVTVPNINARLKGEAAKSYRDALTLDIDAANWELVKSVPGNAAAPSKYLYRYKTVLAAGAGTGNLFTTATVPDYEESDGLSGAIKVTGYMLSSVNVDSVTADADAVGKYFG